MQTTHKLKRAPPKSGISANQVFGMNFYQAQCEKNVIDIFFT
ncbi:conserved hypothetical protein [Photobacterium leiognathi lrivu.4.1]|uniref:Uncharacterized protein n=2 Tax=Photobacterium TaxID=657 RepID=V5ERV0_PHOLE|nr:hypothetical protein VAS14_08440 [Vibrio angustum S14] [Photobacterium angustum S14]GAD32541.1 conserved hypothetical protein [Photobacterium leiognathi lrivu.4.1]